MWITRVALVLSLAVLPLLATGCGAPPQYPVSGTVSFKGKPLEGCKVIFYPDVSLVNPEVHGFGFGVTDKNGRYEIQDPQGEKGIRAGRYKVAFVCWVDSKGKAVPFDAKPSEYPGGLKNLVGDKYEAPSSSPEVATVTVGGGTIDFNLQP
jgi:hypothetical protein